MIPRTLLICVQSAEHASQRSCSKNWLEETEADRDGLLGCSDDHCPPPVLQANLRFQGQAGEVHHGVRLHQEEWLVLQTARVENCQEIQKSSHGKVRFWFLLREVVASDQTEHCYNSIYSGTISELPSRTPNDTIRGSQAGGSLSSTFSPRVRLLLTNTIVRSPLCALAVSFITTTSSSTRTSQQKSLTSYRSWECQVPWG